MIFFQFLKTVFKSSYNFFLSIKIDYLKSVKNNKKGQTPFF